MACTEWRDLLEMYVDGALAEEPLRRVHAHIHLCAACAHDAHTQLVAKEQLRAVLGNPAEDEAAVDRVRSRVMSAVAKEGAGIRLWQGQRALPFG